MNFFHPVSLTFLLSILFNSRMVLVPLNSWYFISVEDTGSSEWYANTTLVAPSYKKGESYSHSTIQHLQSFIELLSHLVNSGDFRGRVRDVQSPKKYICQTRWFLKVLDKVPCLEIKTTPDKAPEVSPATFISYLKHNRPFRVFFNSLLRTLCEYPSTLLAKFKGGTPKERKFIALQSREIVQRFVR